MPKVTIDLERYNQLIAKEKAQDSKKTVLITSYDGYTDSVIYTDEEMMNVLEDRIREMMNDYAPKLRVSEKNQQSEVWYRELIRIFN